MSVYFAIDIFTEMVLKVDMILILIVLFIKLIQKEVCFAVHVINM